VNQPSSWPAERERADAGRPVPGGPLARPAGELKTLDCVYDSEQARAQGLVWEVDQPQLGRIRLPGNPVRYSRSAMSPGLPPPALGEHTGEVREGLRGRARADGS
jgi:crotonobetainyl-CoA:carnitine CoA-transferase CaiB-like acyl-CoA transferase